MDLAMSLTWVASLLCAVGMGLLAVSAFRRPDHFLINDPFFLPLYFAGIVQWILWGIRIEDPAIIYPSLPQVLLLSPLLYRWYRVRIL